MFGGYDPSVPAVHNVTNGNIKFEGGYTDKPFIQAINPNAKVNVNRLLNRICSDKAVEDAEMGWSYFLQSRAKSADYSLESSKISNKNGFVYIDATDSKYDGKVVYVNVTPEMLPALASSEQFRIQKNPSSVVVINIDGGTNVGSVLRLAQPRVEVNGIGNFTGHTASNGSELDRAKA